MTRSTCVIYSSLITMGSPRTTTQCKETKKPHPKRHTVGKERVSETCRGKQHNKTRSGPPNQLNDYPQIITCQPGKVCCAYIYTLSRRTFAQKSISPICIPFYRPKCFSQASQLWQNVLDNPLIQCYCQVTGMLRSRAHASVQTGTMHVPNSTPAILHRSTSVLRREALPALCVHPSNVLK